MQTCASCARVCSVCRRQLTPPARQGFLAVARVRCRPPARWAQRSTTARARRKLPRRSLQLAHTTHAPAHGIGADLLAQEQDGAAACATQQLESCCSPAAKSIRARARSACCSLLSAHLAIRSILSSLQTASNRHEQGGCSRRSATARPQSVRATSRLWARHV